MDTKKAKEFYDRGMDRCSSRSNRDLIEAEALLREAADLGCPEALFELGMMVLGVKPRATMDGEDDDAEYTPEQVDIDEGLSLLKKSAEKGGIPAQVELSEIYYGCEKDLNIEKDLAESAKWCEMAAMAGDVGSMALLGDMYKMGAGVERDDDRAFRLLKAASDAGSIEAKSYLIDMYFDGRGTQKDSLAAVSMMMASKRYGNNGRDFVACYKDGLVPEEMFQEFVASLDGYDDSDALKAVGDLYYEGVRVEKNLGRAFECYKRVADHGPFPDVMYYKIATMYEAGEGVEANLQLAVENYRKAARSYVREARAALERLGVE